MSADKVSLIIPYRNRDPNVFKLATATFEYQTHPFDEIIVSDLASSEEYRVPMEKHCEEHGIKYVYTDIPLPDDLSDYQKDRVISIHLWLSCYNIGIRNSKYELIIMGGEDRLWDEIACETIMSSYNHYVDTYHADTVLSGKAKNLYRVPEMKEVTPSNFMKLYNEARPRGGYAYLGGSREWIYKVRGIDESIRWVSDLDFFRRAKMDKIGAIWTNGKGAYPDPHYIIHLAHHVVVARRFRRGVDIGNITARGKTMLRSQKVKPIRNDDNWGIMTQEKIDRAVALVKGEIVDERWKELL